MKKSPGRPSPNALTVRLSRAERMQQLVRDIRSGNTSINELAGKYGVSVRQLENDLNEVMKQLTAQTLQEAPEARSLLIVRLEESYKNLSEAIVQVQLSNPLNVNNLVNLESARLRVVDQMAKLYDLYTQRIEFRGKQEHTFIMPVDKTAEMMAAMYSRGLLPSESKLPEYIDVEYAEVTDTPCDDCTPMTPNTGDS